LYKRIQRYTNNTYCISPVMCIVQSINPSTFIQFIDVERISAVGMKHTLNHQMHFLPIIKTLD